VVEETEAVRDQPQIRKEKDVNSLLIR
jgi:hypothetical protein